jgi:hypothetical protein
LGHGMLAQMSRHKFHLVVLGCLLVILAGWILSQAGKGTADEHRYRQMLRADNWSWRLRYVRRRLPGNLVRLLDSTNLEKYYATKAGIQQKALLATGYLTNASFAITNLAVTATELSCLNELSRRLRRDHAEFLFCYFRTNHAVVTCRSQDLACVRAAIENP